MSQKYLDLSLTAIVCYCVLAIGVTSVMAKDRVRQEENNGEDKKTSTVEKVDIDSASESAEGNDNAADSVSKTGENKNGENKKEQPVGVSKSGRSDAPVVRIGTSASKDATSLKFIGNKSFDVVTPEWFETSLSKDAKHKLVPIDVMGIDEEMLDQEVKARIEQEINDHVDEFLGAGAHNFVHFSPEEKQAIVQKSAKVTGIYNRENSQEPAEFYFAHLKFDDSFRKMAKAKWVETHQQSRLIQYGLIAGGAFLLIGFMFGGLKLNSATSGFYQGRLQFFVAIVILGVIAAGIYFGTKIDWI